MIGAPDIDHAVEAALFELVAVIKDVRPEVGWITVALDQNLVFFAAGFEPDRAVLLFDASQLTQLAHRLLVPTCIETAFEEQVVVANA